MSFSNNLSAALKVSALSELMNVGVPRLEQNLLKQFTDVEVCKSVTNSRCIALVTQQVNKAIYTFCISAEPPLIHKGPAKSTPVVLKGKVSLTIKSGQSEGGLGLKGFPSCLLQI